MSGTPPSELSTDDLRVFVTAIERGSLNGAARQLGLPKSTVSRRLARLEDQLRARLLIRTKTGLAQTDAGRVLLEPAREILDQLAAVGELVRAGRAEPRGRLRISMPQDLAGMPDWMHFATLHPKVTLELEFSNRYVDLLDESFDLALRAGRGEDLRLVVKRLGSYRLYALASPSYVAEHGRLSSNDALHDHDCVLLHPLRRPKRRRPATAREVRHIVVNDPPTARAGALQGLGVAFLPEHLCLEHLERGELVPVLEGWDPFEVPLYAAYPERRYLSAALARFIEFAAARFSNAAQSG